VAFIQALIFIAQAIAMSIQAKHLRRTVEATEKSVQAVIRMELPIIQAIPGDLVHTNKLIGDDEPYGGAVHHLPSKYSAFQIRRFKNYGRSPAFLEMISVGWMVADTLPNQPRYIKTSTLSHDCVITPEEEFRPDIHYGIELTDDELREIIENRLWLWFYGCLYYRDFMNDEREYRFCWRFANQNHRTMKPYYFFSSDGNPPKSYTKNV
jgi:hypothetical protein